MVAGVRADVEQRVAVDRRKRVPAQQWWFRARRVPVERRITGDQPSRREDGRRNAELTQNRDSMVEVVVVAVVERGAYERLVGALVKCLDRLDEAYRPKARTQHRFHLAPERVRAHGEVVPDLEDAVVGEYSHTVDRSWPSSRRAPSERRLKAVGAGLGEVVGAAPLGRNA